MTASPRRTPSLLNRLRTDRLARLSRPARVAAAALALLLLAGAALVVLRGGGDRVRVTAHFSRAVGLYTGSDVRVLGVRIGKVTKVEPQGRSVLVRFEYDAEQKVPADAAAVLVPPSIVSDRYVQLAPVYRGGPVLRDGADIPLARTATPVELDEIYKNLDDLDVALGPQGANKDGALTRLLQVGADNLDGQGAQLRTTLRDFSQAVGTLSDSREDLFGTVGNLQKFTTALAASDAQVRAFNRDLASVGDQLAGERDELAAALRNLSVALGEVSGFVRENKALLRDNVAGLADVTSVLVRQRQALTEFLDEAPTALANLNLAYNGSGGTLDTRNNAQQLQNPALFVCTLLSQLGKKDPACDVLSQLIAQQRSGKAPTLPSTPKVQAPATGNSTVDKTLGGVLGGGR